MPTTMSVRELATAAEKDVEEVLVTLWYADIDYVTEPSSLIRSDDLNTALRACQLPSRVDRRRKSYWAAQLGITVADLDTRLVSLGYVSPERARNIPKGASSRLARMVKEQPSPVPPTPTEAVKKPTAPPISWKVIGQKEPTMFLTVDEVRSIHEALENDATQANDPIWPPGVKNEDSLASALMRPLSGHGVEPKYPTIEMAAAALVHSLVHNHPFHNGNKRTAVVSLLVFLDRHNQWLRDSVDKDAIFKWMLEVTNHQILPKGFDYDRVADREVLVIAEWIRKNSRPVSRSERPITWRKLRGILKQDFECSISSRTTGVLVERAIVERGFLGRRKQTVRRFQFVPAGDGREVGLGTIKQMRRELHLDETHGVDSVIFYGDERTPDEFIVQYRSLLRALAKV
ncbi:Fic family protein [Microbacterium sp. Au-Mic1]|uniref:type II toxin-antitoxin system death-on-curing family toxin n=1 Tax=Microbacterium sp. Au-Mic1 TaxID=2906457 RepID=UPI001E4E38D7|nr:Fic family protein [Microbacterium sp. Au-Mic1]MCE4025439.1 Fic family protein [Microbacterium sp. Au-Mic1]